MKLQILFTALKLGSAPIFAGSRVLDSTYA